MGGVISVAKLKLCFPFLYRGIYCSCQAHSIWNLRWRAKGPQCDGLSWACSQSSPCCRGCGTRTCEQCHCRKRHAGTTTVWSQGTLQELDDVWVMTGAFWFLYACSEFSWCSLHCSSCGSEVWHPHPGSCTRSEQIVWIWFPVHHQRCSSKKNQSSTVV